MEVEEEYLLKYDNKLWCKIPLHNDDEMDWVQEVVPMRVCVSNLPYFVRDEKSGTWVRCDPVRNVTSVKKE